MSLAALEATASPLVELENLGHDETAPPSVEMVSLQLGSLLGSGAFCEVIAASWQGGPNAERPLALKRIRRDLRPPSESVAIKDLEREVAILASIKPHEHIIRIEAVGEERGRPFVVIERLTVSFTVRFKDWQLAQNRSMPYDALQHFACCCRFACVKRCMRKHHSLWTARLGAARDLASALAHLHGVAAMPTHRVVYRDLKPGNLGFDGDRLVLFDFGLAKLIPAHKSDGADDPVPMTPETGSVRYMSPEVSKGQNYDQSCDVYSFAILLWQLCALEMPYAHMTPTIHRRQVVIGNERPPFRRSWSSSLCSLLANCWAPNPRDRVSADYALSALDRELRDEMEKLL